MTNASVSDYDVGLISGLTMVGDLSIPEIARKVGVSEATVKRVRTRKGLAGFSKRTGGVPPKWSDLDLKFAKELLDDGASYRDAEESSGVPRTTLQTKFPGMGFTIEDTARLSTTLVKLPENLRWSLTRNNRKD